MEQSAIRSTDHRLPRVRTQNVTNRPEEKRKKEKKGSDLFGWGGGSMEASWPFDGIRGWKGTGPRSCLTLLVQTPEDLKSGVAGHDGHETKFCRQ